MLADRVVGGVPRHSEPFGDTRDGQVLRVVDGDTIHVDLAGSDETVRYIRTGRAALDETVTFVDG